MGQLDDWLADFLFGPRAALLYRPLLTGLAGFANPAAPCFRVNDRHQFAKGLAQFRAKLDELVSFLV
ncbi:MAG: hypothetical protein JW829_03115, partial [Pirellulales bacterium]|nr:hypothetical protein [Pirellulales bacterium]